MGGIDETEIKEKKGIWLYEDYIVTDEDGKTYVWAKNDKDKLEKREIKIGEKDEENGDCEIVKGLETSDMIAYPSDEFKEGMKTTDNYEEADVPADDEDGGEDEDRAVVSDRVDYDFEDDEDAVFDDEDEDAVFDDEDEDADFDEEIEVE